MDRIEKSIEYQFNEFKNNYNLDDNKVYKLYSLKIESIFKYLFLINLFTSRIEFKKIFSVQYHKIAFSCLIEAYILVLDNRVRAANLVLRSSIENFIKQIIKTISVDECVNDKVYNINKSKLDKMLEQYNKYFDKKGKGLNTYFEREYGKLSGISHSLTNKSIENIIMAINDLEKINTHAITSTLDEFEEITKNMFEFLIIACHKKLKCWDNENLREIFRLAFGEKKIENMIRNIKSETL